MEDIFVTNEGDIAITLTEDGAVSKATIGTMLGFRETVIFHRSDHGWFWHIEGLDVENDVWRYGGLKSEISPSNLLTSMSECLESLRTWSKHFEWQRGIKTIERFLKNLDKGPVMKKSNACPNCHGFGLVPNRFGFGNERNGFADRCKECDGKAEIAKPIYCKFTWTNEQF